MKRLLTVLPIALLVAGCAGFSTTQTQKDSYDNAGKVLTRTTTTHASSRTFFDSKSALASFKASQTDKSQTATVGSLNQESSGTNAVELTERIVGAVIRAAVKP